MKKTLLFLGIFLLLISCKTETDSDQLSSIITEIDDRESYDEDEYPLGIYTKELYKSEAEYAKEKIDQLSKIDDKDLKRNRKNFFAIITISITRNN